MTQERLYLRPEAFYADQDIELRLQARAVQLHPDVRALTLDDGSVLNYDALALGARSG